MIKFYLLAFTFCLFSSPIYSQTPLTTLMDEQDFIELSPPPAFSFKKGSVKKYLENNRRYISFTGTTALPPYFSKNAEYVFKPVWAPDPKLSMGRWVWDYQIDCDELTFDRENDQVGWRSVRWDPTAIAASAIFCPLALWEKLPSR